MLLTATLGIGLWAGTPSSSLLGVPEDTPPGSVDVESRATNQSTRLARVFADHMVLQRGEPVAIFGSDSAHPGRQTVTVTFNGQTQHTVTDTHGDWRVDLEPMTANTAGQDLIVTGSSVVTLTNILVGDVWLAAGQSNMDWPVSRCSTPPHTATYPLIRMCNWQGTVDTGSATVYGPKDFARLTPEHFYAGTWQVMNASTVQAQSGVAYFFGHSLAEALGVPVGIVDISYGGTSTEAFISPSVLLTEPRLAEAFRQPHLTRLLGQWTSGRIFKNVYDNDVNSGNYTHADPSLPHPHPFAPGFLYRTAMAQLTPFTFKGVIWYQGESNAEFTTGNYQMTGDWLSDYQCSVMKKLVENWRSDCGKPNLPFYMVGLPRIDAPNRVLWPFYREAQARVAAELDDVELASILEYGADGPNVHPPNKEPVGERLAAIARARVYGDPIEYSGPVCTNQTVADGRIILHFDHVGGGLVDGDGGALRNFEIAGPDHQFVTATATIVGDTIEVSSPSVPAPSTVRHAWHMNVDVDLFNADGFSANSFRTN